MRIFEKEMNKIPAVFLPAIASIFVIKQVNSATQVREKYLYFPGCLS